ncbi:3-oxoacyl-ACP synthase [Pandoraea aquatica]|uniref:3-oxoacyl-ACP synthase n=1 Tax=Pandoraea aquatica TaxID=2508290 RepID=A0A5E4VCT0_9BURK|nr:type I polyketide synthase [Pandoraea aquatica]VVE09209.1 3-oxoacyl-ACP synthase [Pandoraea aquatica]
MSHGIQSNHSRRASDQIAVVGIGCRYPGAQGVKEFWENILAKRQQFRPIPACRLSKQGYFSSDRSAEDQTYAWQAAVIDGYVFDWQARRIPKSTFESTDIAHWLALDTAISMLEDAGYVDGERLPRESTRVIVGNTLTGETTRANDLRLRWPYVLSCVRKALASAGWNADTTLSFENRLKEIYKRSFPEANEDSLAGGLSNTIAGRIANYLDLNGGCYTIDGACSSSLLAIHAAATCLSAGQCDFVIAGGVDISLDPFELVGFAKAGALTPTQMRVYDDRGNGFIPGEGSGFVGLKRLSDAIESHDKIYAVLDGWGMSSDGRGGITAPSARGQQLSQAHAYRFARVSPEALDFVEGHGTGTAVGDRAELNALGMTLSSSDDAHVCGITSLKSIVGHTKAAAGIGAFIKSVIAVNQRVLPPTAGCDEPHQAFSSSARALFPAIRGRAFREADVLRAGVSAMGFGGVNVHVTLRSYVSPPDSHLRSDLDNRSAMASWQDSEVFPLTASSSTELRQCVANLRRDVEGISLAELSDLAAHCARNVDLSAPWRAAIVSESPEQLFERLARLDTALIDASSASPVSDREHGFTFGRVSESPRVGLLFPGQGAQRLGMASALMERYRWARRSAEQAEQWAARYGAPSILKTMHPELDRFPHQAERESLMNTLQRTEWAQPSIVLASLIWLQMLTRLGIRSNCVAGHSLGELVAFHAAGAYGMQTAVELAAVRGREMAAGTGAAGAMLSLACTRLQAQRLIGEAKTSGYSVLANINSERQMVVSGEMAAIDVIEKAAVSVGTAAVRLPVSHAFHSKLVERAADAVGKCAPIARDCDALTCVLISSIDGLELSPRVDLKEHFARQIVSPVDFVQTLNSLARHVDVVLEVGPGNVLTNLSRNVPGTRDLPCFPVESKSETWRDINWALANLHVLGSPIVWRELHAERVIRPFIPARSRVFIANPCERLAEATLPSCLPGDQIVSPPEIATSDAACEAEKASVKDVAFDAESLTSAADACAWPVLRRLSAQITGFAEAAIDRESRPLDDLNMDSIKTAIQLTLTQRSGDAVMFRGEGAGGTRGVSVLTLPCELTRHPKKMFAFVVNRGGMQSEPAGRGPGVALSCATSAQSSGPGDSGSQQPTFLTKTRFRAAFKDTWPPVLTLSSGTIAEWMGRLREEHAVDFGRQILDKFDTGVFGMATNHSSVESIARPDTTDLVEGRFWFTRRYGRGDSTLDQNLEWHRIDAAGNSTLIARAKMTTSSTTIVSHGVIEPVNLPAFYGDWLAPRLAGLRDWLESHPSIDTPYPSFEWRTAASYVACAAPALESILCRKIFETSLTSGNLVGNVYFAHYYRWQDQIAEQYFRSVSLEMPHPSAARAGFHCCSASVNHLREAMPFDRIEVVMALQALHDDGLELRFEHYRLGDDDERIKLAVGSARYVWTCRTPAGIAICSQPLPRVLFDALKAACSSFRNDSSLPKTDANPLV